jgi:plastocyanin
MTRTALCTLALAAACGGGGAGPEVRRVEIHGFRYAPDTVAAAQGDTVVWTNRDLVAHTANRAGGWNTGAIAAGAEGRIVAGAPGTYTYVCAYHPTMRATLRVR